MTTSPGPGGPKGIMAAINETRRDDEHVPDSGVHSDVTIMDDTTRMKFTEKLLARLNQQEQTFENQRTALTNSAGIDQFYLRAMENASANNSLSTTPANQDGPSTAPVTRPASTALQVSENKREEMDRLKAELAAAQTKISRLDLALAKHEGPPHEDSADAGRKEPDPTTLEVAIPRGPAHRDRAWSPLDIHHPHEGGNSNAMGHGTRAGNTWGQPRTPWQPSSMAVTGPEPATIPNNNTHPNNWVGNRGFGQGYMEPHGPYAMSDGHRGDRIHPDMDMVSRPMGNRRANMNTRYNTPLPYAGNNTGGYGHGPPHFDMNAPFGGAHNSMMPQMGGFQGYNPHAGTALSPHATEFQSNLAWKDETLASEAQTYLPTTEPMNYRRLLDRSANCNWKYIVDKIVCNNDQQASIFLQQKLKVGTPDQKYDIVESIISQAYPLMVNRFGNFLVQRCFEHGTPEQVVKIAETIRGNTLSLSMDPFGCHVVQKAFDAVPEDYKAIMVHELLRRIPETVIHRYACHVWQKLFELRWSETPPQIMRFVNEALRGMWHEVALGETGSLVVQNIFENCLEADKRPCIEEVLANIDIVAHGQFGNWCIQHICEHGAPPDRSRAIDHVIRYASEYSTDQFASKVVEKCLKIGGPEFLARYLDRVCEGRHDRPRIPLIDIASDQYGNYLVQYILTHASPQHREMVASHIRKHMVSLRGSKFGSRVGILCTNPAVATRPGPGVGPSIHRMGGGGPRGFGNPYR